MPSLKDRLDGLSPAKRRLLELHRQKAESKGTAIPHVRRNEELPLSFAQQRQWLLHQFAPNSPVYNAPEVLRIRGALDVAVLERALNEIVRRHEVLRTTYVVSNSHPVQVIRPELKIPLATLDLRHLPPEERESTAKHLAQEEIRRPLDLSAGPVVRALLLSLAADEHLLVMTFHHIAYDGWSKTVFNRELAAIYDSFSEGHPSSLPELPIQYADYAVWQRNRMQTGVLAKDLEFWRSQLSAAPASIALPTDYDRPQTTNFEGAHEHVLLAPNILQGLKAVSKQDGATLFMSLLSILYILLSRWTGQRDLVVGTVVANRDQVETENLLGCFINFLPLRCRTAETATAMEFLQEVRGTVLQAFAHQDCPFEKIVEDVNPARASSATPFYNVVFLFQNYPQIAFESRTLLAKPEPVLREAAHMDLRFAANETPAGLIIDCDYRSDLFEGETIRELLKCYCSIAQQFVSNLYSPLSEFQISSEMQSQAARSRLRFGKRNIVIASTFTAEMVEEPLRFWMTELEIACEVKFGPFNQIFQSLLDPHSELSRNESGLNVVLVRFEDWYGNAPENPEALRQSVERNADELIVCLRAAASRSRVPYLLCICPMWQDTVANEADRNFFHQLEQKIAESLGMENSIYVVTSIELASLYPVANYEDRYAYEVGRVPYTQDFFTALGTMIARRFYRIHTPPYKVIALDCDNTLWRGICGEDGPNGVEVDAACEALQKFVLAQRDAGMLITLCSKNNEEDVWSVFEQNPGMVLRREHITGYRINWQSKSENLHSLAAELHLGLDTFIFLDDNPLECGQVESSCPDVLVLQLPEKEAELKSFLSHMWAFDHLKITAEDRQRSEFYAQNAEREHLGKSSASLDDFLAKLELQVDVRSLEKADIARVSQLTQRTNQFNFTGIRRTEAQIEELCATGAECMVVNVRDRFGDYGLVGAMIIRLKENVVELDSLLLSCRALGRRVEHAMFACLGHLATARGRERVRVRFAPTAKNQPAREFLASLGAVPKDSDDDGLLHWETTAEDLIAVVPQGTLEVRKITQMPPPNVAPGMHLFLR